jgi:DNA replication licensing factor MCM2
MSQDPN